MGCKESDVDASVVNSVKAIDGVYASVEATDKTRFTIYYIDGSVQDYSISSALTMAILQFCTKLSIG